MTNNRTYTVILCMLYCIAGASLFAKNTASMTLESFPIQVMQSTKGARMVTVSYTGGQGNITRRMIYDTEGAPVMHTAVYLNGNRTDTTLFDREGRMMATMSNQDHSRYVSDGSISDYTQYQKAYAAVKPKRNCTIDIDGSSQTPQGDWTKASYIYGEILRDIEYNETAEYRAALESAQRLIEAVTPEYEQHKNAQDEAWLSLLLLAVFGIPFIAFIFWISRKVRPSLRYIIRHFILLFALGPVFLGVLLASVLNGLSLGMMIPLLAAGAYWLYYGKKYFRKMASYRELSNTYILLSVIVVSGVIGLITLPAIVGILVPIPWIGTLLGYVAIVLQIVYHDPTKYRCPQCHANDCYFEYMVTPAGRLIKVSKDRSGTTSEPVLNQALNRLERETVDTKTTTTSVYQMERVHKLCSCCGYRNSFRRRGSLLSQSRNTETTTTKEHANL